MNTSKIAVYPGTFDPLTLGHEDIIARASVIFDKVILAIAAGYHKNPMFSLAERIAMAQHILAPYGAKVEVLAVSGLMANFVREQQAKIILRGIRAVSDFDYEFRMAGMNKHLMPEVETIFMPPKDSLQSISGTFVREIGKLGGDISCFVSPYVNELMLKKVPTQTHLD